MHACVCVCVAVCVCMQLLLSGHGHLPCGHTVTCGRYAPRLIASEHQKDLSYDYMSSSCSPGSDSASVLRSAAASRISSPVHFVYSVDKDKTSEGGQLKKQHN